MREHVFVLLAGIDPFQILTPGRFLVREITPNLSVQRDILVDEHNLRIWTLSRALIQVELIVWFLWSAWF